MISSININGKTVKVDLSKPLDLSIPLTDDPENPLAWYLDKPNFEPVRDEDWIGSVKAGAAVNFNNIYFNPHAHGTHTECVGHISEEKISINQQLKQFFFDALVVSILPKKLGEDMLITRDQLVELIGGEQPQALVIRTLPNQLDKKSRNYNYTNWPYLEEAAAMFLREIEVDHLLIDLPSVDKEKDEGALLAHKAFWNFEGVLRKSATITEMIYVDDGIDDGNYLLNLQIAPFENDATPSKPILFKPIKNETDA